MTVLAPELLYRDDAFHPGLAVEFDETAGLVTRIAPRTEFDSQPVVDLPRRAIMPGFVNAHSHAFQRVIRGRTQWRPADDTVADFWSWRKAMYDAALGLSADDIEEVSRMCFLEMLRAGITTVGEFHYLQNDEHGRPYADRAELARRVIAAAEDVGIRIRLLNVCYATSAIGKPLLAEQRRFATPDLDAFLDVTETLGADVAGRPLVTVGLAPHSLRAVPRDWLRPLHERAVARDMPLHMHVSEQPAEIAEVSAAYDMRPFELLDEDGVLDDRFTAVHATHIDDGEVRMLGRSGATVCACPTTERDLGDGYLRAADLLDAGGSIALGSDSQTVIDMFEESRLIEYTERLRRLRRVVLTRDADGHRHADEARAGTHRDVAPVLLRMATSAGARSLRLPVGALETGRMADMIGIDLDHHTLAGWSAGTLSAMLSFSAPADVVRDVWVGGRAVVTDGRHEGQETTLEKFNRIARRNDSA